MTLFEFNISQPDTAQIEITMRLRSAELAFKYNINCARQLISTFSLAALRFAVHHIYIQYLLTFYTNFNLQ